MQYKYIKYMKQILLQNSASSGVEQSYGLWDKAVREPCGLCPDAAVPLAAAPHMNMASIFASTVKPDKYAI